jgi:hypothetical protein
VLQVPEPVHRAEVGSGRAHTLVTEVSIYTASKKADTNLSVIQNLIQKLCDQMSLWKKLPKL